MNFKVGDWVIYEFKISQVASVSDDGLFVTSVSDGYARISGHDLKCVPLTMGNKLLADEAALAYNSWFRQGVELNWPGIVSLLGHLVYTAAQLEPNTLERAKAAALLSETCNDINAKIKEFKEVSIFNIKIFARK